MIDEIHSGEVPAESKPVTAGRVACRAMVLSAVTCRGSLEDVAADPEVKELHGRLLDWLDLLNLWDEAEASEQSMLRAPLGSLSVEVALQAGWYSEGVAVFSWALNLLDLPKHDEQVDVYTVTDALWFLDKAAKKVIDNAQFRSPAELEAYSELIYTIHSRLRDYTRNRVPKDFTQWIEKSWLDVLSVSDDLTMQNDLAVDDKPLNELEESRLQEVMSITLERHRAIIWLLGEQPTYSEVTVDT